LQLSDNEVRLPPRFPRQDNGQPVVPAPQPKPFADDFVMAMRFFSRFPTGDAPHSVPSLDRIAPALPFASLAIGFLPALLMMGLCWMTAPAFVAATIGVALMVVVTGAMPEDALADSADGLFGGHTVDRRLEIMKDSRHGTYGVVAIGLYLILRVAALGSIAAVNPLAAGAVMLASTILARSGSLWVSAELPSAREGGASASVGRIGKKAFAIGIIFALLLAFVFAGPFVGVVGLLLGIVAAGVVALAWVWTCRQLVGGQTGDLIGALQALIEIVVLTLFAAFAM
jgi:adenosylcobinamide-GDP ribazoletransferase